MATKTTPAQCAECKSDAVDAQWLDTSAPLIGDQERTDILAAQLCQTHTVMRFGHDILRRNTPVAVPQVVG